MVATTRHIIEDLKQDYKYLLFDFKNLAAEAKGLQHQVDEYKEIVSSLQETLQRIENIVDEYEPICYDDVRTQFILTSIKNHIIDNKDIENG